MRPKILYIKHSISREAYLELGYKANPNALLPYGPPAGMGSGGDGGVVGE